MTGTGISPVYGRNVLPALLRSALGALDPPASSILVLLDQGAREAVRPLLETGLQDAGCPVQWLEWRAREADKRLAALEELARQAVREGLDRQSLLLAAGGGVTTDLGGLLAALLLRGIRWIAVPTTLLGMVDAALGGKTAVDLPEGKNLLGAFHLPEAVLADVQVLESLPEREWRCGLGEVLKSALLEGPELLAELEAAEPADLYRPSDVSLRLATRSGMVKAAIVEEDFRESGRRKLLNLGHTFGHALETAAGYEGLAHGEAVALGILCALRMADELGIAEHGLSARVRQLVARMGLPSRYPGALPAPADLASFLRRDKKARAGRLDLVLPVRPGECMLVQGIEPAVAAAVIQRELGGGEPAAGNPGGSGSAPV